MKYLGPPQSGSLANQTASRNNCGQYYRDRVMPDQTSTARRASARALWADAVSAWQSGTDDERQQWINFAPTVPVKNSLGVLVELSGFQCWMRYGQQSAYWFGGVHFVAPPYGLVFVGQAPVVSQVIVGGHTTGFAIAPTPTPSPTNFRLEICGPFSMGVNFLPGPGYWQQQSVILRGATGPTSLFPPGIAAGQVWGIRVREWPGNSLFSARVAAVYGPPWVSRQVTV